MPSTFKNTSIRPSVDGFDVLYTTPPATSAVAISALCAPDKGISATAHIGIAPAGSSTVNWLACNISVPSNSSVNVLASKVALAAGDRLVANNINAILSGPLIINGGAPWTATAQVILSNPDGSVIVAKTYTGLYRSTDGGKTASIVLSGDIGGQPIGMYFAGAFWIYTNTTAAQRSVDGITWTTVTVTNAPNTPNLNQFGNLVIKDSVAFGFAVSGTRLTSTSDGITWTLTGDALPNGHSANGFTWTGTHWLVVHSGATGSVYRSTSGSGWATVATGSSAVAGNLGGIASVGATVVAVFNGAFFVSQDHGATWVSAGSIGGSSTDLGVNAIGGKFIWGTSYTALRYAISINPFHASDTIPDSIISSTSTPLCLANNRLISSTRVIENVSALSRNAGMTITASVVEVS